MPEVTGTEPPTTKVARRAFVVGVLGLPAWWLLGIASFVPVLMVLPMARDLWVRRNRNVPPHFGWWLLFLVWVLLGIGTLWALAPGSADTGGIARILVFGYRFSWYAACTVLLLWVGTTPQRWLPDRLVQRVLGSVFVVAVVGGLLGIMVPDLAVPTVAERVLPGGLRGNEFVRTLVSAEVADVQRVLGDDAPRPKAPFAYTNTWGSVMALSLVFFLSALGTLRRRRRWWAAPVLVLAAVPVVLSLNRGLWLALAGAAVGFLVLAAVRRNTVALVALAGVVLCGGTLLTATTLGDTIQARLDNPHSNDRRSQLLVATIDSMTEGSPAVGFGSTRDPAGSFSSIAGGATADCSACGVPPLGTQGQLWLVLFSQGWIGAAFFLAFFVLTLLRHIHCRTTPATVATFVVGTFLLQLAVYDTLGLPMMLVMAAIGLAWRERAERRRLPAIGRRTAAVVTGTAVVGATIGAALGATGEPERSSKVAVALTAAPTYLDAGVPAPASQDLGELTSVPTTSSVDTEAALLLSERALSRASVRAGLPPSRLREGVAVSAPPLTTVIEMTVTTPATRDPAQVALAVAEEYLAERHRFLEARRDDLLARLRTTLTASNPVDPAWTTSRTYLRSAIDHLTTHQPEVGRVIRVGEPRRVQHDLSVPATTGLALGGLLGLAGVLVLRRVPGPRHAPATTAGRKP
ncbi:hypothetical protein [Nocardioides sp. J54]|uniref:hypothetical protein n=1 Tax=Nocardioides sp. J54 TaxID=935866 RepID=UPI0004AF5836|nr:hypothetical protein [Nocardioides sp. J54]